MIKKFTSAVHNMTKFLINDYNLYTVKSYTIQQLVSSRRLALDGIIKNDIPTRFADIDECGGLNQVFHFFY